MQAHSKASLGGRLMSAELQLVLHCLGQQLVSLPCTLGLW